MQRRSSFASGGRVGSDPARAAHLSLTEFVESKAVDASSITVETLNGTVMLSGFAKSETERSAAGEIASKVEGVKAVKNQLVVAK